MTSMGSSYKLFNSVVARLKSTWWLSLIYGLLGILFGPVFCYFTLKNIVARHIAAGETLDMVQITGLLDGSLFGFLYFISIIFGVIVAMVLTSYMHNKVQSDYYHSLPITRKSLLSEHLIVGALIGLIVLVSTMLLMLMVSNILVSFSASVASYFFIHLLQIYLMYLTSFAITILAAQLTGHILAQLEMTILLHFGVVGVGLLLYALYSTQISTFMRLPLADNLISFSLFSEMFGIVRGRYGATAMEISSPWMVSSHMVWMVVVLVFAVICSYLLYSKRPTERATNTFVHRLTPHCVRTYLLIVVSLIAGCILAQMFEGAVWAFLLGFIIIGILVHILCAIAYNRNVRTIGKDWKASLIILLVGVFIFAGFHFDVTGYNNYLPKEDSVKSITFESLPITGTNIYNNGNGWVISHAEDVALSYALIKKAQENNISDKKRINASPSDVTIKRLGITWTLNNGKTITRSYSVDEQVIAPELKKLYNSRTYRQLMYQDLMNLDIDDVSACFVKPQYFFNTPEDFYNKKSGLSYGENMIYQNSGALSENRDLVQALMEAKKKDVLKRGFDDLKCDVVAEIRLSKSRGQGDNNEVTYVVYATDDNTLAVLKELRDKKLILTREDIISVSSFLNELKIYKKVDGETKLYTTITDADKIKDILLNRSTDSTRGIQNIGLLLDSNYLICIGNSTDNARYFINGKVPDYLLK